MTTTVRSALRYLLWGVLGIVMLLVLCAAGLLYAGGRRLAATHDAPSHPFVAATDAADIAEGERLARYWGCIGCHESDAGGGIFFETPLGDRLVAPNLTRIVREYSEEELERAIRHGVRRDGSTLVVMPSSMFAHMSDADLGKVVGYLRSLPPVPDTLPPTRLGGMARFFAFMEEGALEAPNIAHDAPHPPSPDSLTPASTRADTLALGRYLAHTGCPECHGPELKGREDDTPHLSIAGIYTPTQFRQFFTDGLALDGTERGLMTTIAKYRGGRLTDDEARALHAYLVTLE